MLRLALVVLTNLTLKIKLRSPLQHRAGAKCASTNAATYLHQRLSRPHRFAN